eukprot:321940_1
MPADAEFETSAEILVYKSFESMGLKDLLVRGLIAYGFERPSAVQQRAIVPAIGGRDLIAQAQSGTGKTSMFSVCMVQRIDPRLNETQALCLSPTRELAVQTQKVCLAIG